MSTRAQLEQEKLMEEINQAVRSDKELTPQKFKAIFNGLSSNTKKIYEAVPISAIWDSNQILRELQRKGLVFTKQTVEANINIIVKNGLVIEHEKGQFSRQTIKKDGAQVSAKKVLEEVKSETVARVETPIDRLSNISSVVSDLIRVANALQEQISLVAIEIQEDFEKADEKGRKLSQLQELLKGIG